MSSSSSQECFVIALYGISDSPHSMRSFFSTIVDFADQSGCPIDKMYAIGPGYGGQPVQFSRVASKLSKTGFEDVSEIAMFSLLPGAVIPMNDFVLCAACSSKRLYAFVAIDLSSGGSDAGRMVVLCRNIVSQLKPEYGIGYTRARTKGPPFYAIGICSGFGIGLSQAEEEEALSISRWGDLGMIEKVYRNGLLRDVYGWNILTRHQSEQFVQGIPLVHWIAANPIRGVVEPLTDNAYLWQVENSSIDLVRSSLKQAGLIFDWRNFVNRK